METGPLAGLVVTWVPGVDAGSATVRNLLTVTTRDIPEAQGFRYERNRPNCSNKALAAVVGDRACEWG